jgi:hypothetical protein
VTSAEECPGELTDAQLDQLLRAANDELLDHVRATADPNRTLTAIMADDYSTEATGHSAQAEACHYNRGSPPRP